MFRNKKDYIKICDILGYRFNDKKLLLQALTRTSGLNEGRQLREIGNFQRLEFIGDKVLNLVISDVLMEHHPTWSEGKLTQEVAKYVNNKGPLAQVARSLELGKFLIMGLGEEMHNRARENEKVLSDAMEAMIGALWLDTNKNYLFLKEFITKHWVSLGLLSSTNHVGLAGIIKNELISEKERIEQFNTAFNKDLSQKDLNDIFVLVIDECDELEILEIILKTKRIEQLFLDGALIISIEQELPKQVELLLQHGADPNAIYPKKYPGRDCTLSALQITIVQASGTTDYKWTLEIVELLLKYGANPNWQGNVAVATKNKVQEIVPEAAKENRGIYLPESDYKDLHSGSITYTNVAKDLRSKNKQQNVIEYKNLNTALHTVTEADTLLNHAIMVLLLGYKSDPNLKNYEGKTALHILCESFFQKELGNSFSAMLIGYLAKNGIKPNVQDKNGDTALHLILKNFSVPINEDDFREVIQKLLDIGIDPAIENENGKTALELVQNLAGHYEDCLDWSIITKMLLEKMNVEKPFLVSSIQSPVTPKKLSETNITSQHANKLSDKPSIFKDFNTRKNTRFSNTSTLDTNKKIDFNN